MTARTSPSETGVANNKTAKNTTSSAHRKRGRPKGSANKTLLISAFTPPTPTIIYDTYWKFAVERQNIFFKRIESPNAAIWTDDVILGQHKFTNAYRASDRVSQFLIRNVIYDGDPAPNEVFFRIFLFKFFNKIETWECLIRELGEVRWADYSFSEYDRVLGDVMQRGATVYSAAYIMPSGKGRFGYERKHQNHLKLIEWMIEQRFPERVRQAPSLDVIFELLKSSPGLGNFLAFQYAIDLNYSEEINFSENDFVVAGPGALNGLAKCFTNASDYAPEDLIKYVTERQEKEFEERGLDFQSLWGRQLHLIDCQNLFCEVDKYSRVKHPEFIGESGRTRIKQIFRPIRMEPISYMYPPKWGLNERIGIDRTNA